MVRLIRLLAASRVGQTERASIYEHLPRPRLWLVKQTLVALLRDPLSALCLILFAQPERTLDVHLLTTRLFLALWSLIIALARPPLTRHAIVHLLRPPQHLGQILVVCEQSREIACPCADISADVAAVVVDVSEFGEGLDDKVDVMKS